MSIKKKMAVATATVALAIASVVSSTSPANAAYNCTVGKTAQGYVYGKCLTPHPGGSRYRVVTLCQNWVTAASRTVYGNTVRVNDTYPSTITGFGNILEHYTGTPWTQTIWD